MTAFNVAVLVAFTGLMVADGQDKKAGVGGGEVIFGQLCVGCHGPDGKAQTPMGKKLHAADLTSAAVQQQTDSKLANVVRNGHEKMPAFHDKLSSGDIAAVVAYVRQLGGK